MTAKSASKCFVRNVSKNTEAFVKESPLTQLQHLTNATAWTVLDHSFTSNQISLSRTLQGGQCFTWRCVQPNARVLTVPKPTDDTYTLSTNFPSFIGAFKRNVVQLGIAEGTGVVIARAFNAQPKIVKRQLKSQQTDVSKQFEFSLSLKEDLLDYLSANENLDLLLKEWRSSGHPITKLLPLPSNVTCGKRKNSLVSSSSLTESPVRLLKQDFIECFFSFLCSQNNNVKRIASLVLKLGEAYGDPLGYVTIEPSVETEQSRSVKVSRSESTVKPDCEPFQASYPMPFYSFPSLEQLKTRCTREEPLREMGFGYRARYIVACSQEITQTDVDRLIKLGHSEKRNEPLQLQSASERAAWASAMASITNDKRKILMGYCGVGRKVADCVLLFSLGERTLVPIDTHMAQLAEKYFRQELLAGIKPKHTKKKEENPRKESSKKSSLEKDEEDSFTLTPAVHDLMQQCFLKAFGQEAGWAHSFLFAERIGEQNT